MREMMRKLALGVAFVTCPCHLPIYILIFGGTALGGFFTQNLVLALVLLTALFGSSLVLGMKVLKPRRRTDAAMFGDAYAHRRQ